MKSSLPTGWEWTTLENVCDKASSNISQNQLNNEFGEYPIFGASGLIKKVSFFHQENEYIGIVKDGAGVGRVTLLPKQSSVIGTLQYLIPKKNVDIKFLFYFLKGLDFGKFVNGSTIPHIYFKTYKDEPFALPPIGEQKKIVEILENSFTKLDQAVDLVKQNIEKINQLNESTLNELFETKNHNWKKSELQKLTFKIGSGSTPTGGHNSYKDSGISLIRSLNVHDGGFREKGLAFIDDVQAKKLSNVEIESNDVLLNITGASVARCCIVPEKYLPARVNQHVSILRANQSIIISQFLHYCLISPFYKKQLLLKSSGGATREALSKSMLEKFQINYPNIEEQQHIVSYLDKLTENNNKLLQHYQNKLQALQRLKNSVLENAFKGEFKKEQKAKTFNLAFYQMQLIGLSIEANKYDNIPQGEMAIAKDMYLLDRLFQVPTKMNFANHNLGPFAPEIKKGITNKTHFDKKNFPNSQASYVVTKNEEVLFKTVSADLKSQVFNGISELNRKLFSKISPYKRAEAKELFATVLKCIEDTQSTDLSTIREAMKNWKIKIGQFKTKFDKFPESNTQLVIKFIVKENWHLKVLK